MYVYYMNMHVNLQEETEMSVLLARLDEVQEELLYYPSRQRWRQR